MRLRRRRLAARPGGDRPGWARAERLIGHVDAPLAGAVAGDRLLVEGWAVARRNPPVAVAVLVDGEVRATVAIDVERDDVAIAHPDLPGAGRSGFRTQLDLATECEQAAAGSADSIGVRIEVIRADGRLEPLAEVTVGLGANATVNATIGAVDGPSPSHPVARGWTWVTGWALSTGRPEGGVEVLVDGEPVGRARLGMARPDLIERIGLPGAGVAGWSRMVDLSGVDSRTDRVTVGAVVQSPDGRHDLGALTVSLLPAAPALLAEAGSGPEAHPGTPSPKLKRVVSSNGGPPRTGRRRLLSFTHNLEVGGAQLYLLELLRHLTGSRGLSARLVTPADGPLRDAFEAAGVPVHVTRPYALAAADGYEAQQDELEAWAGPNDYSLALVNTLPAFPGADLALRRLGLPTVWAIHESYPLGEYWVSGYPGLEIDPQVRAHAERALGAASTVVFEAEATRRQYLPVAGRAPTLTIPFGIDLEPIDAHRRGFDRERVRHRLELPSDARVILCLGTIEPRKCQTLLARAFAELAADHADTILALVGADDSPYCAALREYVRGAGVGGRVRVVPVAHDPRDWLAASDLFVCPSDIESLPRVVLEAMAFELPVLATSIFGIPEVIEDTVNGFLFPPRDLAALVEGLDRVLRLDPAQLREVGAAALAAVRRHHDAGEYAARFERLLDEVLARPQREPREAAIA